MRPLDLYYASKPFIPQRVRLGVRRLVARRLEKRVGDHWPIDENAGTLPDRWPGWPGRKRFAFVLTHDVEGQRGLDRCGRLARAELALGFRSAFNFIPEGSYETPVELRRFLRERGFEVGVHDLHHDGKLYRSRETFARHAERINRYLKQWDAVGFRSGFMLHNLEWLKDLDVMYDASTFDVDPFEPQNDGARTIFPFWVARSAGSGYVELPYTLPQDSTLFLVLGHTNIDLWVEKLDWLASRGGMALVNVHPDYVTFDGLRRSQEYRAELYEQFLSYVSARYRNDAWCALPSEVAAYVRSLHVIPADSPLTVQ